MYPASLTFGFVGSSDVERAVIWSGSYQRSVQMHLSSAALSHTSVCEKNTPPEKKTLRKISLQSAKSGAGEQLLLDCGAELA